MKKTLIEFALELTDISRGILIHYFDKNGKESLAVESKEDGSPVTKADRETESAIRKAIQSQFPKHGILGEELGAEQGKQRDFLWVIDPIDGTKSFMTKNPLFGTLIALLQKGKPILGVIDLPILNQRYWAQSEGACFFCSHKGVQKIRSCPSQNIEEAILRTSSSDMFEGQKKILFEKVSTMSWHTLYGGDCFCYAQLVNGHVGIVMENSLQPHDFMALVPIIEASGGIITDWKGMLLDLNSKGDVLAAANPSLHKKVLAILQA